MEWRIIDTGFNTGSSNMAIDEALLDSKEPVLRFYRWKPACLSLGYFQSTQEINKDQCKKLGIDIVRRQTGGNAVLHDKELTYSVIIDEKEMPKSILESYKMISKGLLQGLKNLNLNPKMNQDVKKEQKSAICFNDPSWYEILVNKKKIIGSAQKRINNKILQHGAILIDIDVEKYCSLFNNCNKDIITKVKERMTSINNEKSNQSKHPNNGEASRGLPPPGWRVGRAKRDRRSQYCWDKNGPKADYQKVKAAMKKGFETTLNIKLKNSKLTKEELKLAKKIESNKYSTNGWNFLR